MFKREIRLFLVLWITAAFTLFLTGIVEMGWLSVLVGAKPTEVQDTFGFLSTPLAWASARFLITLNTSFLGVIGIIFANSYLYAMLLFPCVRLVQASVKRNRVTQLGITHSTEHFDTSEPEDGRPEK